MESRISLAVLCLIPLTACSRGDSAASRKAVLMEANILVLNESLSSVSVELAEKEASEQEEEIAQGELLLELAKEEEERTGIWMVNYYVDEWGEPTRNPYISTSKPFILGTFSNSATERAKLDVRLLIDVNPMINVNGVPMVTNPSFSFGIKLYEYGGKNPVKNTGHMNSEYSVLVKSSIGIRKEMTAYNVSDRIIIDGNDAKTIIGFLDEGGEVKFLIRNTNRTSTIYRFNVDGSHPQALNNVIESVLRS